MQFGDFGKIAVRWVVLKENIEIREVWGLEFGGKVGAIVDFYQI